MSEGLNKKHKGRPPRSPETVRTTTIGVRVSAEEHKELERKAKDMGTTTAQWLRDAALKRRLPDPPIPAINREMYAELSRLSANLNQIAHHANSGRIVTVDSVLLEKVSDEVRLLRQNLIGIHQ